MDPAGTWTCATRHARDALPPDPAHGGPSPPPAPWATAQAAQYATSAVPLLHAQSTMRPPAHSTHSHALDLKQAFYPQPTPHLHPCSNPTFPTQTHAQPPRTTLPTLLSLPPRDPTPTLFNPQATHQLPRAPHRPAPASGLVSMPVCTAAGPYGNPPAAATAGGCTPCDHASPCARGYASVSMRCCWPPPAPGPPALAPGCCCCCGAADSCCCCCARAADSCCAVAALRPSARAKNCCRHSPRTWEGTKGGVCGAGGSGGAAA